MNKKKGIDLSQAFGAVLTLVLVAVLVVVSIYLISSLNTSFPLTTITTTNESGYINGTGYQIKNMTLCRASTLSITSARNTSESSNVLIASGNWTESSSGLITNTTDEVWGAVNFIYTSKWGDKTCEASTDVLDEFGDYPVLIGLVGTIIFLALVIGVLVASFTYGGKRGV